MFSYGLLVALGLFTPALCEWGNITAWHSSDCSGDPDPVIQIDGGYGKDGDNSQYNDMDQCGSFKLTLENHNSMWQAYPYGETNWAERKDNEEKAGRPGPPESWLSPEYYAYQQREDEDDGDQFRVIDRDGGETCFVTDNAKWGSKVKKLFIVDYS